MAISDQEQSPLRHHRVLMVERLPPDVRITPREEAVSLAVAQQMAKVHRVREFRRTWLPDGLLVWEKVEDWIAQHSARKGIPPLFSPDSVALPFDVARRLWERKDGDDDDLVTISFTKRELRALPGGMLELRYALPGHDLEETHLILESEQCFVELQRTSAQLAKNVTWTEAQATVFALTGLTPFVPQLTTEVASNELIPALTRVLLRVDPRLSPREVTDLYRHVRGTLVGPYHKDITEKHLHLAIFAVSPEGSVGTYAVRMERWNELHPGWAYHSVTNFGRDIIRAVQRLLGTSSKNLRQPVAGTEDE